MSQPQANPSSPNQPPASTTRIILFDLLTALIDSWQV